MINSYGEFRMGSYSLSFFPHPHRVKCPIVPFGLSADLGKLAEGQNGGFYVADRFGDDRICPPPRP
jgi:hypothetical protein